jgi:hypothetical protein
VAFYRDAAELVMVVGIDTVLPIHYGMFVGNTMSPVHLSFWRNTTLPTRRMCWAAVN